MIWVEYEIPPHMFTPTPPTGQPWGVWGRIIEARARTLLLKHFHYLGFEKISFLIFADWPFDDDGSLTPG